MLIKYGPYRNCTLNTHGKILSRHFTSVLKIMVNSVPMGNMYETLPELENAVQATGYGRE